MSRLDWIGLAVAAGAAGHIGVRTLTRWWRAGRRCLGDRLTGWMDGLDDLAPGRLTHGQTTDGRASALRRSSTLRR